LVCHIGGVKWSAVIAPPGHTMSLGNLYTTCPGAGREFPSRTKSDVKEHLLIISLDTSAPNG